MVKAVEVFTPTDVPTITYVDRGARNIEDAFRQALSIPKMVVSISGPSKSGKTVLVTKLVSSENLIHIYGASIKQPEDLWQSVIAWMGGPIKRSQTSGTKASIEAAGSVGGKAGIPLLAEAKVDAKFSGAREGSYSVTEVFADVSVEDVAAEIGGSDYVVFLDDFHYIRKDVRDEIGKQIKAAAERGIRIVTASVPHRADDVVRSNTELRGRVTAVDMTYWSLEELERIAQLGFRELNVDLSPAVIRAIAVEAFGSPQLMQAICLQFCFARRVTETLDDHIRIDIDEVAIRQILESTSVMTDFSRMVSTLHAGPKLRGTERKPFKFSDGTSGDVYRCVLLALRGNPAALSFRYDEMVKRVQSICIGESPVGSSVSESLAQMGKLARTVQEAPVIEWDEDVLDIVEPYFLFYLRCSPHLNRLAQ